MKILVIDDSEDVREAITFLLVSKFKAEVIEAVSGNKGIACIKQNPELDCIICDYNMADGNGGVVYNHLQKTGSTVPFILCSSDLPTEHEEFKDNEELAYVVKPDVASGLTHWVSTLLTCTASIQSSQGQYVGIPLSVILKLGETPCALFIRLSDKKYVKVFNSRDAFTKDNHFHYANKGVAELFVNSESMDIFINGYFKSALSLDDFKKSSATQLRKKIAAISDPQMRKEAVVILERYKAVEEKTMDFEGLFNLSVSSQKMTRKLVATLGMSTEVFAMAKVSVNAAMQTIFLNPGLSDFFRKMSTTDSDYINAHSVMLSSVSCWMATQIGWNSELTRYKLSLAALLHDITLSDPEMAKLHTIFEIAAQKGKMTATQLLEVEQHPFDSERLIRNRPEVPPGVDTILRQHHERPDGTGFPTGITEEAFTPFSALFILSHELVDFAMKHGDAPWDVSEFVLAMEKHYNHGCFKKILEALDAHARAAKIKTAA